MKFIHSKTQWLDRGELFALKVGLILAGLVWLTVFLVGCTPASTEQLPEARQAAEGRRFTVHVVAVEGHDYVVVVGNYDGAVAVCPKVEP